MSEPNGNGPAGPENRGVAASGEGGPRARVSEVRDWGADGQSRDSHRGAESSAGTAVTHMVMTAYGAGGFLGSQGLALLSV